MIERTVMKTKERENPKELEQLMKPLLIAKRQ
jgi:hypothetical protein